MSSQSITDRRDRTRNEIRQLIEDRNSVLSHFYQLAKLTDEMETDTNATLIQLEDFCQELVDYLAKGHFEIYRRIEEGTERRSRITTLAASIMERINATTQVAIDFNDTYDSSNKTIEVDLAKLPAHLTRLGEELATRIELEDQFINTLLGGSQERQAVPEPA
jgi:regulator of sigma D